MAWESINVRDHGAIGDGIVDDTAAIQAALRQACHVHIPAGRYRISQIKIPPECRVTGDGCNQTWLFPFGEQPGPLVTDQGNAQKIMIEHIGISGQLLVRDGLIKLGFGTSPWGTQGVIYSCQIRDCPTGYGIYIDQNISLVERSYILKCKTGLYVKGNEFVMNHVQILGCEMIDIVAPCILRNLEIEAPQGPIALNVRRKALISDIHISLSKPIEYAVEFGQKAGSISGFLYDAKPGARCKWVKYPGGEISLASNVMFDPCVTR